MTMTTTLHMRSPGLWALAWRRLRADRVGMAALAVVAAFLVLVLLSATGMLASDWEQEVAVNYAPPTFVGADATARALARAQLPRATPPNAFDPLADELAELGTQVAQTHPPVEKRTTLPFGADKWGHDIVKKTIKGGETSIVVGLVAALLAVALGTLFGAVSGLILTVAAVLQQKGVATIVLILGLTGWTGPYRLMRAEYIKHGAREYVMAADAIGASSWSRMFGHILPNVSHVALVQMSILVVGFIKAEVILSFLGFGVPVGTVSWGSMLNEAQNELILGKWWQLAAAAGAMALLVTSFSLFADALRDALDPKIK
jgi:ABC-type dipeptide/oligopeptide/nickel transport system permease subunit